MSRAGAQDDAQASCCSQVAGKRIGCTARTGAANHRAHLRCVMPWPLFSIESRPSTRSPHRLELCPGRPGRRGVGAGGSAPVSWPPPAAGKVRGCSGALTLLTRKPSLSTPSSMPPPAPSDCRPRAARCPARSSAPAAPRKRLRPGAGEAALARVQSRGCGAAPGRKSVQVGISDVV